MVRSTKLASLLGAALLSIAAVLVVTAAASPPSGPALTGVPTANTRSAGYTPSDVLSPELQQIAVAQGSTRLENPSALTSFYGYDNDVLNVAGQPAMVPSPSSGGKEAHKTEPDENTYLVFKKGLGGADPNYDYGTHFLFQGHEGGAGGAGYITRVNLDADAAHRVTLMATKDASGNQLATIDGSTWDPWAKRLLFTTENAGAPTYAMTPDYPALVTDVSGAIGRGGYEGIRNDGDGNLWIDEDIGGSSKPGTKAKFPNSYIYRYVPKTPGDLEHGRLQALQALQVLAKAAKATPFKRPENGAFQPDSGFKHYFFDETGDTNKESVENANGGWGSIFELSQGSPSAQTGTLRLFYKGDEAHAGFDNVTFLSKNSITFVEDAGDTLHTQRNALDSGWVWNVKTDYSDPANQPLRWLAEGRDASATLDADNGGFGSNEGDNEITGVLVSDGDPSANGVLGAQAPELGTPKWRWFYTQQHGDNVTWEVQVARP
jgi:hypothetical protein